MEQETVAEQLKVFENLEKAYCKNYFAPDGQKELLPVLEQQLLEVKTTILGMVTDTPKAK